MNDTLRRMRNRRADGDRGFTLIELLVVVVIIGVLVAIAIPVYLNYTKGAANRAAESDVRNAVVAVEQCYTDNNNTYPATVTGTGPTALTLSGCSSTVNVSSGVTLTYTLTAGPPATYTIAGKNASGNETYTYSSSSGQTTKSP